MKILSQTKLYSSCIAPKHSRGKALHVSDVWRAAAASAAAVSAFQMQQECNTGRVGQGGLESYHFPISLQCVWKLKPLASASFPSIVICEQLFGSGALCKIKINIIVCQRGVVLCLFALSVSLTHTFWGKFQNSSLRNFQHRAMMFPHIQLRMEFPRNRLVFTLARIEW